MLFRHFVNGFNIYIFKNNHIKRNVCLKLLIFNYKVAFKKSPSMTFSTASQSILVRKLFIKAV